MTVSLLPVFACGDDGGAETTGSASSAGSTTSAQAATSASSGSDAGFGGATTGGEGGGTGVTGTASAGTGGDSTGSGGAPAGTGGSGGDGGAPGSGGAGGAGSGGGPPADCTELTLDAFGFRGLVDDIVVFPTGFAPELGDAGGDRVQFAAYTLEGRNGDATGTFDLSDDDNFATCARCFLGVVDETQLFFQRSGTLVIDPASLQMEGTIDATVTDLILEEVTIDGLGVSTPVDGGACLYVAAAPVAYELPPRPQEWQLCPPEDYGDFTCNCDCGADDPVCAPDECP